MELKFLVGIHLRTVVEVIEMTVDVDDDAKPDEPLVGPNFSRKSSPRMTVMSAPEFDCLLATSSPIVSARYICCAVASDVPSK